MLIVSLKSTDNNVYYDIKSLPEIKKFRTYDTKTYKYQVLSTKQIRERYLKSEKVNGYQLHKRYDKDWYKDILFRTENENGWIYEDEEILLWWTDNNIISYQRTFWSTNEFKGFDVDNRTYTSKIFKGYQTDYVNFCHTVSEITEKEFLKNHKVIALKIRLLEGSC